jgi:hypothetical protein
VLLLILSAPSGTKAANCGCSNDIKTKLAQPVRDYDNRGMPLIATLLSIADKYDVAMGIEKVTKEAVERPASVKLQQGSLSQLLDLCVGQVPGYSWTAHDEVVHVFGGKELTQASNLFNLVVPSFEIREQTLNTADQKLGMIVLIEVERPKGIVGSYLPSSELEDKRVSFAARNTTVREILNALVRLHGKSVWIARVPPQRLSQLPQAGLWKILPHSIHDPTGLLEPFPEESAGHDQVP